MDLSCSYLDKYRDQGLLIMRVGLGSMFIAHGWPKITGGAELWGMLGGALGVFCIHFAPVFWGFMATCAEFFGGILLLAGLLTRPALVFLICDMFVASSMHLSKGDSFTVASHAIELGIVFVGLYLIGPGRFSLDSIFMKPSSN